MNLTATPLRLLALGLSMTAALPAQIPGMPGFPGGGPAAASPQMPSLAVPVGQKGRSVEPRAIMEGEFWPDHLIQSEDVDTGFASWHWELRIRPDGNLEITRTRKSQGTMEQLAGNAMMPVGLSQAVPPPASAAKPAVSIWRANHDPSHAVKCVVFSPNGMHTRLLDWSPRAAGRLINPIDSALDHPLNSPSDQGFTLYHGALAAPMPNGTYQLFTPVDKEFEEDKKKLGTKD